jgi:hypothetical protein
VFQNLRFAFLSEVDIALLKIRQRGKANAVAQFFKIL